MRVSNADEESFASRRAALTGAGRSVSIVPYSSWPFAGVELARRIERAECGLLADAASAARRRDPAAGAMALSLGGGIATWTGPGSPFNKVAGLGGAEGLDEDALENVEAEFRARGAAVQVELANLGDPSIGARLTRRGYVLVGFENVLGLPLPAAAAPTPASIEVTESGPDELAAWLDVVVAGFASADAQGASTHEEFARAVLETSVADLAASGRVRRYLARVDGRIAGAASLRAADDVAQLCGSATLPAERRRGVQTTLLGARLAAAKGCDIAVVTTAPGSRSQQNVQRLGFGLLYSRAILVRGT